MKNLLNTLRALAIGTAALYAPLAHADTVVGIGGKLVTPTAWFGQTAKPTTVPVWTVTDGDFTALALCIEPLTPMTNRAVTGNDFAGFDGRKDIDRLFSTYYGALSTTAAGIDNAAFQLALWELYNDNDAAGLAGGKLAFSATSLASRTPTVVTTAAAMLATARNENLAIDTLYDYRVYTGAGAQPVVAAFALAPVPEPSTVLMLGAGLALVGYAARRRRS